MPGMIIVAVLVEGFLQEWPDFGTLLTLLFLNGAVGFWEDLRAGDAVAALKASLKPIATVKREGVWRKIDAALLVPGDRVSLAAGCNVPADCRVDAGMEIQVDQAAMTGESLPVQMGEGDVCKMGSTIVAGETDGTVATTGINTFFGKTAALISSTHDVGNFQRVIIKITKILLYMSLLLVSIAGAYLMFKDGFSLKTFWPAVSFCVVLLVASIPIAMQVVCTATMALGSRLLAAQKAIVARLSSIEQLAGMTVLCSDKTGMRTPPGNLPLPRPHPRRNPAASCMPQLRSAQLLRHTDSSARPSVGPGTRRHPHPQ
jgi:H+-transporting ATPase